MSDPYGLVLGGGGAKGAFEIGVWQALREQKIEIGAVIGTSVGALNAAIIVQNNFDLAYSFWSNLTLSQVLDLKNEVNQTYRETWSHETFETFRAGFLKLIFDGGLNISPLRDSLKSLISEESIRKSPIRFGLVTVDLTNLTPRQLMIEDIPEGQLLDYLLASSALPVFQKQEINGNVYLDGGFFDNVPVNFMVEQGFKKIISVELPVVGIKRSVSDPDIEQINISSKQIRGGMLDFNETTIQSNLQLGYLEALKSLGLLSGKNYYLDQARKNPVFDLFNRQIGRSLPSSRLNNKMHTLLSLSPTSDQDAVLKKLRDLHKRTEFKNFQLAPSMLEITGKVLGIEKFEAYSADALILLILQQFHDFLDEDRDLLKTPGVINRLTMPGLNQAFTHFSVLYFVFLILRDDLPVERMAWFTHLFTPEMILAAVTLLNIHTCIRQIATEK
ncbi:patatin-like phospholipase family protein [Eubacteriaceae bacterium ES2]|nr:patatin-like phospholipase family protein [Eubacteriaceae bacterium ES2]